MTLRHPFQKLSITTDEKSAGSILFAATGPNICSFSVENGKLLSVWPGQNDQASPNQSDGESHHGHSPSKRRKLDSAQSGRLSREGSEASEESVEIVAERKKGERRRPKIIDSTLPKVSHLLMTANGRHLVAITSEDKAVKVFETRSSGRLQLLSSRSLPKRLCALKLTLDNETVLTADKFGDVYSMPLFPSSDWVPKSDLVLSDAAFQPTATELTVHSKRNREALRQQRELQTSHKKREGPRFEHKLLLGHVSLLTDLEIAQGVVSGRQRSFILTADRDEHIRVSRGIPQAHIIETYCLGHTEFVSKICVIPWAPDLLVAGNGEPSLRLFKWQTGDMVQEHPLTPYIGDREKSDERATERLVVSGIWPVVLSEKTISALNPTRDGVVLVAYEGLPILETFYLDKQSTLRQACSTVLAGNVLDIVQLATEATLLVSLDAAHEPFSTKKFSLSTSAPALVALKPHLADLSDASAGGRPDPTMKVAGWTEVALPLTTAIASEHFESLANVIEEDVNKGRGHEKLYSSLGEFLYGLENLRKKTGPGDDGMVPESDTLNPQDILPES